MSDHLIDAMLLASPDLAEAAMRAAIRRRLTRAVILRDEKAFDALVRELRRALVGAFSEAMRRGISLSLDRLRDLGPGKFTAEDGDLILRALEREVGEMALQAAMREPVLNLSEGLYRLGLAEVGTSVGTSLAFIRPDQDALDVLARANTFWVGNLWDTGPKGKITGLLEEYFTTGLTRETLARRLAEDFAGVSANSLHHWRSVANSLATRTREIGRVSAYERAGISHIQIKAVLDDRTTTVCRHLHGRVLAVRGLRSQAEAWMEASSRGNRIAAFAAWPFHGDDADFSATPTASLKGIGLPPYHHGNCRTTTVAYFGDGGGDLGRWTRAARDREPLSRKDAAAVIERAKVAKWPHLKVVRGHFRKHGAKLGLMTQADFSQAAIDLIRAGDREVYLSMRKGGLNATFVRAAESLDDQKQGFAVTAVDLVENKITSHHWRQKIETTGDEVPALKQPGRGIVKWLTAFLG